MQEPKFAFQNVPRDGNAQSITDSFAYCAWNNADTYEITQTFLSIPQHIKMI